jgi:serine/threonine protein kinase
MNDFLRRYPQGVPLALAKSILLDLATAIEELHQLQWRRGEICPSDILIQPSGAARMSAVNFSNVLREQGQITGSFAVDRESLTYMTPERFYGNPATPATDQYSLALLAIELLSGEPLRRVMHPCDLAFKEQLFTGLESGRHRWAERSPEFAGLLRRMLRIDPEERWPSMTEVVERLREIEVAESPKDLERRKATSGYLQLLAASGRRGEREFFGKFYHNLFASDPAMEARFESLDMERQYRVLNLAIYWLLEFRADSATAKHQLEELAARHAQLGLEARHYELFLEAFMQTLADYERDPQRLEAWRATLGSGIAFMANCATAKQAQQAS